MQSLPYLKASERTEKKFPNGLAVPSKEFHELAALFSQLFETCQQIDQFKKRLIYKGIPAEGRITIDLSQDQAEILHAVMGMTGEVGELAQAIGLDLRLRNPIHIIEELGDIYWYIAILLRKLSTNSDDIQATNIRKLKARYPEKYTDDLALTRNLDLEHAALQERF